MSLVLDALCQNHPTVDVAVNAEILVKHDPAHNNSAGWIVYYETWHGFFKGPRSDHLHWVAFVTTRGIVAWSNEIPQEIK